MSPQLAWWVLLAASRLGQSQEPPNRNVYVVHPAVSVTGAEPGTRITAQWRADTLAVFDSARLEQLGVARPRRIHLAGEGIALTNDLGGIVVLDARGRRKWSKTTRDIGYVSDARMRGDSVWLLDRRSNSPVVVLPGSGQPQPMAVQRVGTLTSMVPLTRGRFVLCQYSEMPPCVYLSDPKALPEPIAIKWSDFGKLHRLMRTLSIGMDAKSDRWVMALSQGDGWFAFDANIPLPFVGHFIEHHEFPDIITDSTAARVTSELARHRLYVLGATVGDSLVSMLFKSDDGKRYIDQYRYSTGEYVRSILAPSDAVDVVASERVLYVLASSPLRIITLRNVRRTPATGRP